MKIPTADRLNLFPEYVFSHLAKRVKEIEAQSGEKVLNLGPGSPDIPPSPLYIKRLQEYQAEPNSHLYPPYGAIPELTTALISWYKTRFDVDLEKNELYPLLGAKDGVVHLPCALLNGDDEALIPDPGYPGFSGPVLMWGGKVVTYNLTEQNNFKPDLDELSQKITSKTRYMWLNFPGNPTGQVLTLEELEPLIDLAINRNIVIVYDNAYSEITFDGYKAPSILQIPKAKAVAVEIGSFSKTFSFAGYRMGWIVGNREVIAALTKIKSQMDSGMSLPLQKLGAYALTHFDQRWYKKLLQTYSERRSTIQQFLTKLGLDTTLPQGSLYIWARIPSNCPDSVTFCNELLEKKHILLVPGTAFGINGKKYVRASICVDMTKARE